MEVSIPICLLGGLNLDEIEFNSECAPGREINGKFVWNMGYNECGIERKKGEEGKLSFENNLKTRMDKTGYVFPVLPAFNIPLRCDQFTKVEFLLDGNFSAKVISIESNHQVTKVLTGDLEVYSDHDFAVSGGFQVGFPAFVQSSTSELGSLQVISCVSSPSRLVDMIPTDTSAPVWPLIEEGCILDETLQMLPR